MTMIFDHNHQDVFDMYTSNIRRADQVNLIARSSLLTVMTIISSLLCDTVHCMMF